METPFEESLTGLALAAVMAISGAPASEALNVPGEPRLVGGVILNCLRFPLDDADQVPTMDEAVIAVEDTEEFDDMTVEPECHFINVHDVSGKWRIDFSYHYVLGMSSVDEFPYNIGVAGLAVINSTSIPDDQMDAAMAAVVAVGKVLLDAHAAGDTGEEDPLWSTMPSSLVH